MNNTNNKDVLIASFDIVKWALPFLILAILFGQPVSALADRIAKHASTLEFQGFKVQLEKEFANKTDPKYINAVRELKSEDLERFLNFSKPSENHLGYMLVGFSEEKLYVNREFYSDTISKLRTLGLIEVSNSETLLASLISQYDLKLVDTNETYLVYGGSDIPLNVRSTFDTSLRMTRFGGDIADAIFDLIKTAWK